MDDNANEDLVRRFCEAFARADIDELLGWFTDDAVYHNIPIEPAKGKEAIRANLEMFVTPDADIKFDMLNVGSAGDVVFTERVDHMTMNGSRVGVPVAGVFEIEDGKIKAWRDYFDLQQFLGAPAQ